MKLGILLFQLYDLFMEVFKGTNHSLYARLILAIYLKHVVHVRRVVARGLTVS